MCSNSCYNNRQLYVYLCVITNNYVEWKNRGRIESHIDLLSWMLQIVLSNVRRRLFICAGDLWNILGNRVPLEIVHYRVLLVCGGEAWWSFSGVSFGRGVSGGASDGNNLAHSTIFLWDYHPSSLGIINKKHT